MRIATVGRTVIKLHPMAVVLGVAVTVCGDGETIFAFFLALILHEAAHGVAATMLHFSVPEMEFTPFGGVAKIEDLQSGSMGQQIGIAAAGPLISWLLCLATYTMMQLGWVDTPFIRRFLQANVLLMVFNLLPVLPLDGGRIMYALTSPWLGWQRAVRIFSSGGVILGAGLVAFAIWGAIYQKIGNLSLVIAGCYLMYAANISRKTLIPQCIHGMISKKVSLERQGVLRVDLRAAGGNTTVQSLYRKLEPGRYHQVWVVDAQTLELLGTLSETALEEALLSRPNDTLAECLK